MSLQGNFHDFSMLETLQLIGLQRKTGVLEVESSRQRRELQFQEGRLCGCHASRPEDPDPLLEALVLLGLCDARQARSWRSAGEHRESEALRLHCGLDAEEMAAVHRFVVQATVDQVLLWDHGEFRFDATAPGTAPDLSYHLEEVVLESMRRLDETAELRAAGLPPESIPHLASALRPGAFEEWDLPDRWLAPAVARQCDGRRSIGRIARETGLAEYDLLQILTLLRQRGLVRVALRGRSAPGAEKAPEPGRRTPPRLAPVGALLLLGAALATGWGVRWVTETRTGAEARQAEEKRARFDLERTVRHLLELRKIRAGRYPASLDDLTREGLWPERSRAELASFSYAPGQDGLDYELTAPPDERDARSR